MTDKVSPCFHARLFHASRPDKSGLAGLFVCFVFGLPRLCFSPVYGIASGPCAEGLQSLSGRTPVLIRKDWARSLLKGTGVWPGRELRRMSDALPRPPTLPKVIAPVCRFVCNALQDETKSALHTNRHTHFSEKQKGFCVNITNFVT